MKAVFYLFRAIEMKQIYIWFKFSFNFKLIKQQTLLI